MAGAKSLYYLLKNAAAVTAIVGTGDNARIYPLRLPQKLAFPAITYQQITNVPTNQKDAVSGFDKVYFDVDCWSKDYDQVIALGAAVRAALDRITITSQGETVNMIVFQREVDGFDNNAEIFHKLMQFLFVIIR